MKTFKILAIQITLILCSTLFSNTVTAQKVVFAECVSCQDNGKGRIYFSPINLINPGGSSFQLTYGKTIGARTEVQVSAWKMFSEESPIDMVDRKIFGYMDPAKSLKGGYRLGLEVQQAIRTFDTGHFYAGAEAFYRKDNFTYSDDLWIPIIATGTISNDNYDANRIIKGGNLKMGIKTFLSQRVMLDAYAGFGLSTRVEQYKAQGSNEDFVHDTNIWGGVLGGFQLPWNVKIVYEL